MFNKGSNIVISLGDDGAIVGAYTDDVLVKRIFVTTHSSSDFSELVKAFPNYPIYLLLDTIDQNYIFSSIPNIGKGNVKKIVKRKLANEFDQNDINSYILLGKENVDNKETFKYLFVSVRNATPVKEWLDEIYNLPNRFAGIYLLPVESEHFIKQLHDITHGNAKEKDHEWEVFVSYNRVGGFRQVVLKGGRIIFTRISQSVSMQTPDAIGKNISQEASNTLEYIRRIGYYDQSISMYIICSKEAANFVEIPGIKPKDVYCYTPFEVAQKMNLPQAAQESDKFGDVIFSNSFILNRKKKLRMSTPQIKKSYKMASNYKMVRYGSFGMFAVLPVLALYFLINAFTAHSVIKEGSVTLTQVQQQLANVKDFKKVYGINPQELGDSVTADKLFSNQDKDVFDTITRYQGIDIYSTTIKSVSAEKAAADLTVKITSVFDFTLNKNYSDILYQLEQFTNAVKNEFKDKEVTFDGLPDDKDVKLDMAKENGPASYTVTTSIKQAKPQ